MAIHREGIDLVGTTAFPLDPQVVLPFEPKTVQIFNTHATQHIDVSYDGAEVHARLHAAGPTSRFDSTQAGQRIWLRASTGTGATLVEVVAQR